MGILTIINTVGIAIILVMAFLFGSKIGEVDYDEHFKIMDIRQELASEKIRRQASDAWIESWLWAIQKNIDRLTAEITAAKIDKRCPDCLHRDVCETRKQPQEPPAECEKKFTAEPMKFAHKVFSNTKDLESLINSNATKNNKEE